MAIRAALGLPGETMVSPKGSVATTDSFAEALIARQADLAASRTDMEGLWDLAARYTLPNRAIFTEKMSQGHNRERMVLDSTAPQALELFASSLHGMLNDPTHQWFDLTYEHDEEFGQGGEVQVVPTEQASWAYFVARRMMRGMTTGSANIYTALHEVYLDLGLFGTACLFVERDPDLIGGVRCYNIHMKHIVIDEGENGMVDFVIRSTQLTPRQAQQRWPNANLGKQVEKAIEDKSAKSGAKKFPFLHVCFPATDKDLVRLLPRDVLPPMTKPYLSVWVNVDDKVTVAVSGYDTFPYMVPRWVKAGGHVYGRSPAMTVLGDVLMVNRMSEITLRGAEKLVDPPMRVPFGGLVSPVRLWPGGLTFTDGDTKLEPLIPPGASRIELGEKMIADRQGSIRAGFFAPLFLTPDSPVKTATQVLQQVDERNRALSPMAFRLNGELFDPLLKRVFNIQWTDGVIPPPPDGTPINDMKIRYLSPIAASVRQLEALSLVRLFETMQPWAAVDQGAFDWFDTDNIARVMHEASGAPPHILLSKAKVVARRKARAEAEQAQQMMGALPEAATAAAAMNTSQAAMMKAQKA